MSKTKYIYARRRGKKSLVAVIALTMIIASLIGGVFAWTDFTQARTNKFHGNYDADVTLHDEFDGENKDVFVENSGTNTIYVRVRLDEFMMVGDTVFATGANVRDKTTWTPHTYDGADITNCGQADVDLFHKYYKWNMPGSAREYASGTPGMVYGTLGPDGKVNRTPGTGLFTLDGTPVITMTEFLRLEIQAYDSMSADDKTAWDNVKKGCWILDDSNTAANGGGWAYWSMPLEPGAATNLLLDKVTLQTDPSDDWIYRIDVKLQAVSLSDTEKWHNTAIDIGYRLTDGARVLIRMWNNL